MEYSHDDAGLAHQPIGYWSWAAHNSVVTHIRTALAELGLSQPQWWVLNQLVDHPEGRPRTDVVAVLEGYLSVGGVLEDEIDALAARKLITQDGDKRLRFTDEGRALQKTTAARQEVLRAEIHAGITDEEYVRTLKVLQRMIHNTAGQAWHH
ncbi:MarR family winged helix-turn-helix transcriptional regulator [Streptomyces sp. ISL-100]|uniref:MarR family winged helix-turn-helix transcriptional regulator n=1 Tax=Streptomyces sp. ISL-100 TaxID=2819173 RepID=UPI001BE5EBAE|nr:MarR family winged helix-turn-helix transcriptional regulator [Streptomyces sp. ISL-100]MBT2396516.1 winged helix-turn-helix transcriptional regulator [Streptomyces sp. ISL-100]